jgi:hypothetical protein
MNVAKKLGNENFKATIHNTDFDTAKTTGKCEMFQTTWIA